MVPIMNHNWNGEIYTYTQKNNKKEIKQKWEDGS